MLAICGKVIVGGLQYTLVFQGNYGLSFYLSPSFSLSFGDYRVSVTQSRVVVFYPPTSLLTPTLSYPLLGISD